MSLAHFSSTEATALSAGMTSVATAVYLVDGSTYPDPAVPGNGEYTVIIGYGSDREEVCTVTAKPGANQLTVTRGQDGSAAVAKNIGDIVVHGVSARDFDGFVPVEGGAMTGPLTLSGAPTDNLHAATKLYVDSAMPLGAIIEYGGTVAPTGWHLCDGTAHGSAALQSLIGSANTPDLRDLFIVGAGSTYADKATGGAATVTLTAAQSGVPAHDHVITVDANGVAHTHSIAHDHPATGTDSGNLAKILGDTNRLGALVGGSDYFTADTTVMAVSTAQHAHTVDIPAYAGDSGAASATSHGHTADAAANATASAASAHENRPPYYALTRIIKKV